MNNPNHEARCVAMRAGMTGLLVGDALGVPYEFQRASALPPLEAIEFEPPEGFRRSHATVAPGTWSDDGAHALCLLASLVDKNKLDLDDLARRLVGWQVSGYMAVDGLVFDIGHASASAIDRLKQGILAEAAGLADERSNGNGALMRVLPLAIWHEGPDHLLARDAMRQSLVTHGHLRSKLCCAVYCLWARYTMAKDPDAWRSAVQCMIELTDAWPAARAELDGPIDIHRTPGGSGTGYVVDCLHSARAAVEAGSYEHVVKAAVALGNDTDTTAAVAGGLAALRDGIDAIPGRWLFGLRGRELVEESLGAHARAAGSGSGSGSGSGEEQIAPENLN